MFDIICLFSLPILSIGIGILTTAIDGSLSFKVDDLNTHKDNKNECRKTDEINQNQNHLNKSRVFSVSWKGINKMTILFAAFMVSIGVLGRDSSDVSLR
jgi:hypothetical protein